jgi:hypothetical protein
MNIDTRKNPNEVTHDFYDSDMGDYGYEMQLVKKRKRRSWWRKKHKRSNLKLRREPLKKKGIAKDISDLLKNGLRIS